MNARVPLSLLGVESIIVGGGEMGARMRALDWSSTPLGPVETWPQSLRSAISILLPSRAQIVLFWGRDLVALYNDAYRPVFGAKHPWALGRPARDCWREIWDVLGPLLDGVVRTGEAFWAQDHPFFLDRRGYIEETYFDVSYDPVRIEDGSVGGVFCIVSETTGRVVGERRLRTLRELGGGSGEPGTVADVYRAAAAALATDPADVRFALLYALDEAGRRLTLAATAGVEVERVAGGAVELGEGHPLASVIADGRPVTRPATEFVTTPPPGTEQASVLPITSAGRPVGVLVVGLSQYLRHAGDYQDFLDLVTARASAAAGQALAYEAERRRNEALAELDRAKTAFFSNVSHEFRTPLTLMLGPLEDVLATPGLGDEQRAALAMAQRNGLRLLKLVNTLLEFSRIEAGRAQAAFAPVDLARATAEVAAVFRAAVEAAGLRLVVECPALSEPVWVDREMWDKIVLNLVSNAFKFTFEGTIAVRLGERADGVVLEVEDTGVGIAAAELPHIFERFHRVRGARARSHEGTGIGLALVKELVTLHGGTIVVDSQPDCGTRVSVTLSRGTTHLSPDRLTAAGAPARPDVVAAPYVEEALRWLPDVVLDGSPSGPGPRPGPARILVADDNADMRDYLRRLLAPHWSVETVGDGEAALETVRGRPFDLVLTDVMMPRLDGYGLLSALRADPATRTLPVIMLSARAGEESRIEGLDRGADDYLVKPFSARELLARVNAQLALARVRREATEARARLLEQERALRMDAEAANRAKDEFLAMLAHELRNPLGVILNGVGVLDRLHAGGEDGARIRRLIGRQAHHLARLLDDLLDVARIRRGKIVLRRETIDLRAVVDLAVQGERHRLEAKGQHLTVMLPPEPVPVHGDPARLQQVVSNLVNNASKYTAAEGDVAVELRVEAGEANLVVRDTGIGISGPQMASIFDLFVQLDTPIARSEGGLGIGLTLVRQLVEQHDGTVRVASAGPGQGTAFTVTLPLAAGAARPKEGVARTPAGPLRDVLLVEDNDDAREALRIGLELAGHRVRVASDGGSGIQRAMEVRPDVAVIDVGLPGLDGYQVARALRQKLGPNLLLIALTGYGQADDQRRALEAGFDIHLTKPIGVEDLERVISRARAGP
jgi:signal transduction histidine kinase